VFIRLALAGSEFQADQEDHEADVVTDDVLVGRVLDVSRSTVQDDWRSARAWLGVRLRDDTTT